MKILPELYQKHLQNLVWESHLLFLYLIVNLIQDIKNVMGRKNSRIITFTNSISFRAEKVAEISIIYLKSRSCGFHLLKNGYIKDFQNKK